MRCLWRRTPTTRSVCSWPPIGTSPMTSSPLDTAALRRSSGTNSVMERYSAYAPGTAAPASLGSCRRWRSICYPGPRTSTAPNPRATVLMESGSTTAPADSRLSTAAGLAMASPCGGRSTDARCTRARRSRRRRWSNSSGGSTRTPSGWSWNLAPTVLRAGGGRADTGSASARTTESSIQTAHRGPPLSK